MGIWNYVCARQRRFPIEVRATGESSACCGVNLAPPHVALRDDFRARVYGFRLLRRAVALPEAVGCPSRKRGGAIGETAGGCYPKKSWEGANSSGSNDAGIIWSRGGCFRNQQREVIPEAAGYSGQCRMLPLSETGEAAIREQQMEAIPETPM